MFLIQIEQAIKVVDTLLRYQHLSLQRMDRTCHLVHGSKPEIPLDPAYALHETSSNVHEDLDIHVRSLFSSLSETGRDITKVLHCVFGDPYWEIVFGISVFQVICEIVGL
jgi:hypothetical protein